MRIPELSKLINKRTPGAITKINIESLSGKKIAINANMSIIMFKKTLEKTQLTDKDKKSTTHLLGMFYRTASFLKYDIKPVYVFDEKTYGEHIKKEEGEEVKKLFNLMGVEYVDDSPENIEATCSALIKANKVYGAHVGISALAFSTDIIIRILRFDTKPLKNLSQISYQRVLEKLNVNADEFIDLCILMGCDYCEKIKRIGGITAYKLIKEHSSIEEIIEKNIIKIPENWKYKEAREKFKSANDLDVNEIKIQLKQFDENELMKFLCEEKNFNKKSVQKAITRFRK